MMDAVSMFQVAIFQFLDFLDYLICIPLAYFFSKLPMSSLLKKLEMGVFFFCWRQAVLAEDEGQPFAIYLRQQAESEHSHAHFFSHLEGGNLKLDTDDFFNREPRALSWATVNWDENEVYQVDGISTKFIASKIFFMGREANSFSWQDKLAFMVVLERFQTIFYQSLIKYFPEEVQFQIEDIASSEELHSLFLESGLIQVNRKSFVFLMKWQLRKYLALLALPIDLWRWRNGYR
jgi:hypothetical protein